MAEAGTLRSPPLDEPGVQALASAVAPRLRPPLVVYLQGDLGAGKTTFVRALLRSLGHGGPVKSPTYGLLEHYSLDAVSVLHLDLYRLGHPGELEYLGIADLFEADTLLLVEWPERGQGYLPAPDLVVRFHHYGEFREIEFLSQSDSGKTIGEWWENHLRQNSR